MRTCIGFVAAVSLAMSACGGGTSAERREYKLQGQIISVSPDHKEAMIKHEDIPGFMSAMTMAYHVRDAKEYEPLVPGDLINATLVVVTNDAYVESVKKVGNAPLERAPGSAAAGPGMDLLAAGAPVPNVKLVDQDGAPTSIDALRGSAIVLTFTYVGCPDPTMCPLVDKHFVAMQKKLQEQKNELRVRLLTVSIDPAKDTPAALKKYGQTLGLDPHIWTMATGDRADIDPWALRFGVSVSRAANNPSDITHNLRTAIIDRQGNLVQAYSGSDWTPDQILADVRVMVGVD